MSMLTPDAKKNVDEMQRQLFLGQELDIAAEIIRGGLSLIQISRMFNQRYFPTLLLLANGLERLLKIILVLHTRNHESRWLSQAEHKKLGHNLKALNEKVLYHCFTANHLARPITHADQQFLDSDPLLKELLDIMSAFATKGRYAYLDGTADPKQAFDAPDRLWDYMRTSILNPDELSLLAHSDRYSEIHSYMNRRLLAIIERYIRALIRIMAYSQGSEGKRYASATELSKYLHLDDDKLGTLIHEV